LHGGLVGSWPRPGVTATVVTEALREQRSLIDATWPHRRVRAEVDLDQDVIRVYALRRREPMAQPLLRTTPYQSLHKRFECDQNLWRGANHATRPSSRLSACVGTGAAL
jgi:hypothetical protein